MISLSQVSSLRLSLVLPLDQPMMVSTFFIIEVVKCTFDDIFDHKDTYTE